MRPEGREERPWLDSLDWGRWPSSGIRTISSWLTQKVKLKIYLTFIFISSYLCFLFRSWLVRAKSASKFTKEAKDLDFATLPQNCFMQNLLYIWRQFSVPTLQKKSSWEHDNVTGFETLRVAVPPPYHTVVVQTTLDNKGVKLPVLLVCWWISTASFWFLLPAARKQLYCLYRLVLCCFSQVYYCELLCSILAKSLALLSGCTCAFFFLLAENVNRHRWNASGKKKLGDVSMQHFRSQTPRGFASFYLRVAALRWLKRVWLNGVDFRGWRRPPTTLWLASVRGSERSSGGSSAGRPSLRSPRRWSDSVVGGSAIQFKFICVAQCNMRSFGVLYIGNKTSKALIQDNTTGGKTMKYKAASKENLHLWVHCSEQ